MLSAKQNSIAVFNSLGWKRDGMVTADLPDGQEIIDSTTKTAVPYEILFSGKGFSLPG
jgi:alpha-mannosidase